MSASRRRIAGIHAADAAIRNSAEEIVTVWIEQGRRTARLDQLVDAVNTLGISVQVAGKERLNVLAEGHPHQGIVIEMLARRERGENDLREALEKSKKLPLFLVLDHVQDPHNLGACLRSADAAGADGVVITKDQSTGITPTVAKLASGAAETMPVYRVTNLVRALGFLKEHGLWVGGADGAAPKAVYEADFTIPLALVLGAEGKGMRRLTRDHCDFLVSIPMAGHVESLNVSVATGVLLFEAVRQRRSVKSN